MALTIPKTPSYHFHHERYSTTPAATRRSILQGDVLAHGILPYLGLRDVAVLSRVSPAWNRAINQLFNHALTLHRCLPLEPTFTRNHEGLDLATVDRLTTCPVPRRIPADMTSRQFIHRYGVPNLEVAIDKIVATIAKLEANEVFSFQVKAPLDPEAHFNGTVFLGAKKSCHSIKRESIYVLEQKLPAVQSLTEYKESLKVAKELLGKISLFSELVNADDISVDNLSMSISLPPSKGRLLLTRVEQDPRWPGIKKLIDEGKLSTPLALRAFANDDFPKRLNCDEAAFLAGLSREIRYIVEANRSDINRLFRKVKFGIDERKYQLSNEKAMQNNFIEPQYLAAPQNQIGTLQKVREKIEDLYGDLRVAVSEKDWLGLAPVCFGITGLLDAAFHEIPNKESLLVGMIVGAYLMKKEYGKIYLKTLGQIAMSIIATYLLISLYKTVAQFDSRDFHT